MQKQQSKIMNRPTQQLIQAFPVAAFLLENKNMKLGYYNEHFSKLAGIESNLFTDIEMSNFVSKDSFAGLHILTESGFSANEAEIDIEFLNPDNINKQATFVVNELDFEGDQYFLFVESKENNNVKEHERLLSIIDTQQDIIFRFTPDTRLIFVNDAYCNFFRVTRKEMLGKSFLDLVQKSEHHRINIHIESLLKNKLPVSYEYKESFAAGNHIWWEWSDYPILDGDGNVIEIQTVGRDISRRKTIEGQLEKSEKTNSHILKTLPDLVFRIAKDGTYLETYSDDESRFYIQPEVFLGKKIEETLPTEIAQLSMTAIQKALTSNQIVTYEYVLIVKGQQQYFENRILPVSDDEVLSVIREVTAAKKSEIAIRNNERYLRKLLTLLNGALTLKNHTELLAYIVQQTKELFQADNCFITRWDEHNRTTIPMLTDEAGFNPVINTWKAGEQTLTASLMDEGQAITVENVMESPYISQSAASAYIDKSLLGIPLISNESKYGGLIIGYSQPHEFTITELERANLASGILSLLLSNNTLFNELRESEKLMRSFIEQAPVGVMAVDAKGNYILSNAAANELFGYSEEEILQKTIIDIVHEDYVDVAKAHFEKLSEEKPSATQAMLRRKNGSTFWASVHGIKINDNLLIAFHIDITEILESRQKLAHEKALLSGLLKSIPDMVYYKDLEGRYIGCNEELERLTGLPEDQIIGKKDIEILPLQVAIICQQQDESVIRNEKSEIFEEEFTTKDGLTIPLETLKAPFYSLEGELIGIVALSRDVSLRKAQETEIKKNHNLLRNLTLNLPGVLFQFHFKPNGDFDFPYLSERVPEFFNHSADEIRKRPRLLFRAIHSDDISDVKKSIRKAFRQDIPWETDFRIVHPEKGVRWMRGSSSTQVLSDGRVIWHGYLTDVTDKKEITEQLKQSEERLQSIFNHLHEVIWSVEMPENQYGFISPSCERLFGYTQQEILNRPQLQFEMVHPDDEIIFQSGNQNLADVEGGSVEYRIITKSGEIKWVHERTRVIKDESGSVVRIEGILTDISDRKHSELVLKQSEERFDLALSFTEAGLWDWNIETGYVYYSDTWKKLLGFEPDEIQNNFEEWRKRWHPDDEAMVNRAINEYLNKLTDKYEVEYRIKTKSGDWKWVVTKGKIIFDAQDKPIRWIGTNSDISLRKELEQDLRFTTAMQEILMNMAGNMINLPVEKLDEAIQDSLALVGEFAETDRAYLFSYDFVNMTASNTHEWCNKGIEPQIEYLQNGSIEDIPDWIAAHKKNEVMVVDDVSLLEPGSGLRNILEPQDIKSLIAVPLRSGDQLIGFLGFDSVRSLKKWKATEIILLRFMAEIFVNAKERIHNEKALIESEGNLKLATEASGTGIWTADFKTDQVKFNTIFAKLAHLPADQTSAQIDQIFTHIHPGDFDWFFDEVQKVSQGKEDNFQIEMRINNPDASFWWGQVSGSVVEYDSEGFPVKVSGTLNDITERKLIEIALTESEERFKSIYNNSAIGLYRTSLKGEILMANPAIAKLLGFQNKADFANLNVITDGFLQEETRQNFLSDLLDQGEVTGRESVWKTKTGKKIIVKENARLVRDVDGKAIYIDGSVLDISDLKNAEESLKVSEEKFRQLAENIDDIIWLRDAETFETIYVNPAFDRFTSLSGNEFGKDPSTIRKLIHPEDKEGIITKFGQQNLALEDYDGEFRLIIDGNTKWVRTRTKVIRDDAGKALRIVGIGSDVTRLKQAEASLRETLETEKQLGMLKSRFVSMASHEFRTPLATIQATTETLQAYHAQLSEDQLKKRLEKILSQIDHLKSVMDDVLNLSKIQEGKLGMNPQKGELVSFIIEIIEEFQAFPSMKHTIRFETNKNELWHCFDPKLMRQVFNNLISNAIKYSPPENDILINLLSENESISVEFLDGGIGIPDTEIKHLFDPFFRAKNATNIQGTGLGLTITKQAIELHSGTIAVESRQNLGTKIICRFPKTINCTEDSK